MQPHRFIVDTGSGLYRNYYFISAVTAGQPLLCVAGESFRQSLPHQGGCGAVQLEAALAAIGYRVRRGDTGVSFGRARPRRAPKRGVKRGVENGKGPGAGPSADSPFAKLRDLEPGK